MWPHKGILGKFLKHFYIAFLNVDILCICYFVCITYFTIKKELNCLIILAAITNMI